MEIDKNTIVKKIRQLGKSRVKFITLFGSYAKGTSTSRSDIDIAVFYDGNEKERFNFRIFVGANFPDRYDIQIFQDLPLYVKQEIFKYGKVIYGKDSKEVYECCFSTIKEYERMKKFYEMYYERFGEQIAKV